MTKSCRRPIIGSFEFDLEAGELRGPSGTAVPLRPQTVRVLNLLLARENELVTKGALMEQVWGDTHVTDDSLVQCISEIRKALGPEDGALLKTVPRRGYRLQTGAVAPGSSSHHPALGWVSRHGLRLAVPVAVVVALGLAGWLGLQGPTVRTSANATAAAAVSQTIAVLPFDDFGISERHGYLPEGLVDDLTTALAKNRQLTVISRDSAFLYRDTELSSDEIFERLDVHYLLRGSMRSNGERIRVNARLSQAGQGDIVWADTFEVGVDELFDLESRIMRAVSAELTGHAQPADTRDLLVRTSSEPAYRSFQLGRQLFFQFRDSVSNRRARELFLEAISHDPDFAMAHAMLALTHSFDAQNGWAPERSEALDSAEKAARLAISKDPTIPLSYFVTGLVFRERGDYAKATAEARKAIERDPNYATAHVLLSTLLYYAGQPEKSVEQLKKAIRLNPHHPFQYNFHLGQAYFTLHRYEDAIRVLRDGLESNPSSERLHVWLAASYARAGHAEEAAWEAEQVRVINPGFSIVAVSEAYPYEDRRDKANFVDALKTAGLN
jgi:TolB-like protein/DNA-binding winged helix-turn-helix (wHTH) protein/Tfp pilus assembly protein PilF